MSADKLMRIARDFSAVEVMKTGIDLRIEVCRKRHSRLVLTTPDGQWSRFVVFASTPSCKRWLVHLRKDLRRVMREMIPVRLPRGWCTEMGVYFWKDRCPTALEDFGRIEMERLQARIIGLPDFRCVERSRLPPRLRGCTRRYAAVAHVARFKPAFAGRPFTREPWLVEYNAAYPHAYNMHKMLYHSWRISFAARWFTARRRTACCGRAAAMR